MFGNSKKRLDKTIGYLKKKRRVLIISTSSRWTGSKEDSKSFELAKYIAKKLGRKAILIDASKLLIYTCEGNVSDKKGNHCGPKHALLKDNNKNPSGYHRCWASYNHKDDELWKISRELFKSQAIVFFGSVRWGSMNSIYQKLIERLTWIDNRHSTLGEENIVKDIDAGLIILGQQWNGKNVVKHQKKVLGFFGFRTPKELFWNWQYTKEIMDESKESYARAYGKFMKDFGLK